MARGSQSKRRRRRIAVGAVIAAVVVVLVGAGIVLRPSTSSASSYLTSTVRRADVSSTVSASGSLVDQYTYSVSAGSTPVLTELAGVATGASASAVSSSSSTSGSTGSDTPSGSSSGTSSTSGTSGTSSSSGGSGGYTTRSIAVSLGEKVAKNGKIAVARDSDDADHTVKSPVAGHVRSLTTAVGASASSVGAGRQLVSIDVDENRIAAVRAGQTVALTLGSGGASFTGTVRSIAQLPNGSSGVQQYQVLVTPTSTPHGSRIGMTVTASIRIDSRTDVLTVPAGAVTTSNGHAAVRVLNATGALRTVRVETGLVGDSAVEIVSGLTAGRRVVTGSSGTVPAASTVRPPAGN